MRDRGADHMMPEFARHATLVAALALAAAALAAGCAPASGEGGPEVSGRVATGTGVSLDFPAGWVEVPEGAAPFTKIYRNAGRQLELRLVEGPANGLAVTTHGDQMKRGLARDGAVEESGPATVGGRPAYKVVVAKKTAEGSGLVVGVTMLLDGDRISTLYLSSAGVAKPEHRTEIEALLATLDVE
jgi:hypothetical protein